MKGWFQCQMSQTPNVSSADCFGSGPERSSFITAPQTPLSQDAPHTLTAQERQANLSGRLAVPHLRALLEEAAAASEAGSEPDVAALAARFRIDERLLRLVLRHNKLPPRPK